VKRSAGHKESGGFALEPRDTLPTGTHGTPMPSRADILAFIAREREAPGGRGKAKIGKREIARAFNLKGHNRIALKDMLKELEAEGAITRRGKRLHKRGSLPQLVLGHVVSRSRDGDLIAEPVEWDEEHGPVPQILFLTEGSVKLHAPAPAVGDRALLRVEAAPSAAAEEPAYSGRVIKLLPREKSQLLGIFRADPQGGGRAVPVAKKNLSRGEFFIAPGDEGAALDRDLVAIEALRAGRFGFPAAKVRERLGAIDSEKSISLIAIHAHQIPHLFGKAALA
jgi:ribonuclease R